MSNPDISDWLFRQVDAAYARHTRVHPLASPTFKSTYVKREDELSSGIVGSKIRKYASLIPFLSQGDIREVAIVGGPNSNNIVGLLQALHEANIHAWLFLREAGDRETQGNALLIRLLADDSNVQIVSRSDWPAVESIASAFLEQRERQGKRTYLIREGGLDTASLAGSMTLAQSLLRNEIENSRQFRNVFVDSGTGMTAIGLILGIQRMDPRSSDKNVWVTLVAGNEEEFQRNLAEQSRWLESQIGPATREAPSIAFLVPPIARFFGAVNDTVLRETLRIAREEKLLLDPVYSVKHYMAAQSVLEKGQLEGESLWIFNGSPLGLAGFQKQLGAIVR